ncbi:MULTISPECIES: HAD family hydrolase [Streptomyces]|uniref:HAD hydrolase-like protein n=2 Tax=Streptomyces TaxID=1883 RepID=A0ABU4KI49_9ACTN|nr:HAD family hydrolase [Streptomyces roseolus]MDX2297468.1 HAD hydrolase-like protein [Streptomyces roseolus]
MTTAPHPQHADGTRSSARPVALLDLDDTLTDRAGAFSARAREFSACHAIPERWLDAADAAHSGRRRDFFALAKATYALPGTVDEHDAAFRRRTPQLVPYRPAVNAAVQSLADRGWHLAVVTNGDHDAQHAKLAAAGLADLLTTVVVSSDHGVRKSTPPGMRLASDSERGGPGLRRSGRHSARGVVCSVGGGGAQRRQRDDGGGA